MRREIRIGLLALLPCLAGADPALRFFSDPTQRISPISIAQDRRGFLWLAADEGVFRFDGYNFQKIEGDFDTPSTVAMVGPAVLVAAKNGLFAYVDGVVKKISGRYTVGITSLTNDLALTLEMAPDFTPQLAGVSWSERGGQVHPQKPIGHWAWLSRDGWLWQRCGDRPCGVRNDANLQKAIREGEFREYVAGNRTVLDGRIPYEMGTQDVQHLLRDSAGRVYSRAFFSGVVTLLDGHQPQKTLYVGNFTRGNSRPGMYEDHLGRIWISGDFPWLMEDGKLHKVAIRQIEGQQVNCVFEDAGGRIWLGVAEKGLAVLGMGPLADVEQLSDAYGEVTSIMRAGPSSWLAATAKGILLRKESHRSWTAINENTSRPGISYVTGGRGTALGLFRLGGLVELSADGRVLHGFGTSSGIQDTSLRRVIAEPDGSVLCGGKVGLCRYSGGHWTTILRPTSEFNVQDIALDSNGAGWAAIEDNVCRVVGDRCEMVLSAKNGLLGRPLSLSLGANGDLWVAYRDRGFSRFRRSGQGWSATHFKNARGDRRWNTTLIRVDRRGWVWRASHDDGVWVSDGVHTDAGDWIHISEPEGLPSAAVGRYALLEDDDGSVWVGTENGIAQLRPDSSWFGGSDRPRITALSYGNRRFLDPGGFPLEFEQPGSLSIRVSGFAWLPLRYRLHPTDRDWKVSEKGDLVWPGLSPGRYEVEVARGWNSEPVRFVFRIQRSVATMLKNAGVVALPIAGFAGILAAIARRRRRRKELPTLPDLTEARAEILRSESERLPGATLDGRFVLGQAIARGGFGTVFAARDLADGSRCAVKLFREEFGNPSRGAFDQEMKALELIAHPNVVRTVGHGITPQGSEFIAMEFVEGETLRAVLRKGGVRLDVCGSWVRQIGAALAAIHAHHICHGDIKPDNLMIRAAAPPGREVVVIDFSVAIIKNPDQSVLGLSRPGGTIQYLAPEQALGYAAPESDIYSLAKVVIEMITGKSVSDLFPMASTELPARVREHLAACGPIGQKASELLASALEFDPTRRPKDIGAFAEAVADELAGDQAESRP